MSRGLSSAAKDAMEYLRLYPETSARILSVKFGIDTSTIYRSRWWQENKARVQQAKT